jgi:sugar-specific transcriptional regulator TrmB
MTIMPISDKMLNGLTSFGLTGNEAKVYLSLLQLSKASAAEIAKLANIPRQEVYRVLPRLEKIGLVEVIIDKPTKYLAISPHDVLKHLIGLQKETLERHLFELRRKKTELEDELKEVEGRSAGLVRPEPIRFMLISGQNLINERIREMLQKATNEVLWIAPKAEIKHGVAVDRDRLLHNCTKRNVKVRIVTEIDETNVDEVEKLSKFCEIKHSLGVTSVATIVDHKELIIGSAIYPVENSVGSELMHELWTNDSSHINLMRDFFEKVWNIAVPAVIGIEAIRSGRIVKSFSVIQGEEKVKAKLIEVVSAAKSKLFIVSYVNNESIELIIPLLEDLRKRSVLIRWVTVVDQQNNEVVQNFSGRVSLRVLKDRPVSFVVTESECMFSSSPLIQIPREAIWSFEQGIVTLFWALAEETWNKLSENVINSSKETK